MKYKEIASRNMGHRKKQSFGQHFLHDISVVEQIIDAANITNGELVLEIGPGEGVLTKALLVEGARVCAVEADEDLIDPLQQRFPDADIVQGSALDRDLFSLFQVNDGNFDPFSYKLVANLPYNIASRVFRRFLSEQPKPNLMVVMVQKEVADRIIAEPPNMSMLSIACQLYADCARVVNVPPGAFDPPPSVDSSVVKLRPKQDLGTEDPEYVLSVAKVGFSSKRKQLKNNLARENIAKKEAVAEVLREIGLPETARAQTLTVENWITLANYFKD